MEYQALYRTFRPLTFRDMVGQESVTRTLRRQVSTGHIAHAYLFCGTRGTGKTTTARVLAHAVNCLSPKDGDPCGECEACLALRENDVDIVEIDAASNNSVDDVRMLQEKLQYAPARVRYKVYIIDEVHMLSSGAFNALLKTLEEPPSHAVFILATTEPRKLPATILSRCQRYDFRRFRASEITGRLRTVLESVGRTADEGALLEIARVSEGTMRDALNLLDICLSYTDGTVTQEDAREVLGTAGREAVADLTRALVRFDAPSAIAAIDGMARSGGDIELFARDAADRLRAMLLSGYAGGALADILEITREEADELADTAKGVPPEQLVRQADLLLRAEQDMRRASSPRTVLELAVVRACLPEREKDASVAERLAKLEERIKSGIPAAPAEKPKAEKPAAPPKRADMTAPAAPAPARPEPTEEYKKAIAILKKREVPISRMLDTLYYAGMENGNVLLGYSEKDMLIKKILEKKTETIEQGFSEVYGQKTGIVFVSESDRPKQDMDRAAKDTIARAYELFDRADLEITD